ncbi:hypothetical protein V8D89_000655 [Ganoderma adspersum]
MPFKIRQTRRPSNTKSVLVPASSFTTSEYWVESPPEALRQEIARRIVEPGAKEEVVKAISNQPLQLKILWNLSLPINRLPCELLVHIFILVHSEYVFDPNELSESPGLAFRSALSKLMGTCRRWRDVIVETPAFWCVVSLEHSDTKWMELCLARSLPAPIEIWARVPTWCKPDRLKVVHPLGHRIRSLCFAVHTCWLQDVDTSGRDWPLRLLFGNINGVPVMPALEKLNLAVAGHTSHRRWDYSSGDLELTLRHCPHLRSLSLAGMFAPQDTALYSDLRTLSLTTCSHTLTIDQFLDALALCSQLETLYLKDTLNRFSDSADWTQRDPDPRRPLISFPRLDTLVVSENGATCTSRFLAHIHVRASVRRLEISAKVEPRASDPSVAVALSGMLPPRPADALEPLSIATAVKVCSCCRKCCGGVRSIRVRTGRTPKTPLPVTVATCCVRGSVRELVGVLGHETVTALEVEDVYPDAVESWAEVFRAFPRLERLSVCGPRPRWHGISAGIENVFLGLHAASHSDSDSEGEGEGVLAPGLACPNLLHVSVECEGRTALYEAIRTCVRYRSGRGVVLGQLDLNFPVWDLTSDVRCACVEEIIVERVRQLEELAKATPYPHGAGISEGEREGSIGKGFFTSALRRLGGCFSKHVKLKLHRMAKGT